MKSEAIHEAGHCVVAELIGIPVKSAHADGQWKADLSEKILGYAENPNAGETYLESTCAPPSKLLPIVVAGVVAEEMERSNVGTESEAIEAAGRAAMSLARAKGESGSDHCEFITTLKVCIDSAVLAPLFAGEMLLISCEQAARLLWSRWPAVCGLAVLLDNRRTVTSHDVTKMIQLRDPSYRQQRWASVRSCSLAGSRI